MKVKLGILSLVAKAKCFIRLRRFYHPRIDQSRAAATGNVVMGYGRRAASLLVPASPRYPSTIDSKLLLTNFSAPTRLFPPNRGFSRILRSPTTFGRLFSFLNAPKRPGAPSSLFSQPPSIRLFSPRFACHGVAAGPFRRDNSRHEESFQAENLRYANLAALVAPRGLTADHVHPTESDSDSEIESYSNRGYKLKKKARFARQGQLVPNNGPSSYREVRCLANPSHTISDFSSMLTTPVFDDQSFIAILH